MVDLCQICGKDSYTFPYPWPCWHIFRTHFKVWVQRIFKSLQNIFSRKLFLKRFSGNWDDSNDVLHENEKHVQKFRKRVHHGQVNNDPTTNKWTKYEVKRAVEHDSSFDRSVCSICHPPAFFYAKLCLMCLSGKMWSVAVTSVRQRALYAVILTTYLLYPGYFLSKRYASCWHIWSLF